MYQNNSTYNRDTIVMEFTSFPIMTLISSLQNRYATYISKMIFNYQLIFIIILYRSYWSFYFFLIALQISIIWKCRLTIFTILKLLYLLFKKLIFLFLISYFILLHFFIIFIFDFLILHSLLIQFWLNLTNMRLPSTIFTYHFLSDLLSLFSVCILHK